MVEKTFHDFVRDLCLYYERKEPREQTLDLWFREVKHLPDEPLDWIRGQICNRHEIFPRNLPAVMSDLWRQWLENNPRKKAQTETEMHCNDCDSTGIITVYKQRYRYAFRCSRCKQAKLAGVPFAFLSDLLARGYTLTNTHKETR